MLNNVRFSGPARQAASLLKNINQHHVDQLYLRKLLGHLVDFFLNLNRIYGLVFCEIHSKIWDKIIKNCILVAHDLILDGVFLVFHHMDPSAQVHAPPCTIVQYHRKIMSRKSTKAITESGGSNIFRLASALAAAASAVVMGFICGPNGLGIMPSMIRAPAPPPLARTKTKKMMLMRFTRYGAAVSDAGSPRLTV